MSVNNHNPATVHPVVRVLRAMFLWLALGAAAPAFAVDSGDIFVTSLRGDVQITMNGAARTVRPGGVLELPASVRTGHDGNIELRQGATTLSVGPDTLLNFPALERRGAPIDVIQQPRGNVFYDIGKRTGRKLRVETPYLVGVVKGTQFNVAASSEAATISLFEGLLEVRAADDSDVVDLEAGEIAARKRGDKTISVIRMDSGKVVGASGGQNAGGGNGDNGGGEPPVAPRGVPGDSLVDGSGSDGVPGVEVSTSVDLGGHGTGSAGVSTEVRAPGATVGADVSAATAVTAGSVSVDVTATTSVDLGTAGAAVETSASATVSAGPVTVDADAGVGAAVDAGASGIGADVNTSTSVDAGPIGAAVDTATSVDVGTNGATTVDTGVSLGVANTPIEVSAGASAGVDLSTGTVDLGLSVAGANLGLGLDLGLGGSEPATDTDSSTTDTATDTGNTGTTDLGGLLDGLLRRPGRQ